MREIALHILNVVENGITAGADCIHIDVDEDRIDNLLSLTITDNGNGVPAGSVKTLTDPFVTSRTNSRVGLGLSLLHAAAKRCEGNLTIDSQPGKGARITVNFRYDHIDRAPIGDLASTLTTLIMGNSGVDFVYRHRINGRDLDMDTREIKEKLGIVSMSDPTVIHRLKQSLEYQLKQLEPDT